jgi:RNA polymerase sigma-70 factor (ECF subfamily)
LVPLDAYARGVIRFKALEVSKAPPFTRSDFRDIEQELAIDLMRRARHFNPARGKWQGFVRRVVANSIANMMEGVTSRRHDHRSHAFSLNEIVVLPDGEITEHHELREGVTNAADGRDKRNASDLRIDLFLAIETLPEDLKFLCLRLRYETVREMSRSLGLSREQIYRKLRKARALLTNAGLRDYLPAKNHGGNP